MMRIEYPLYDFLMNEEWYDIFLKRNIIGWVIVDYISIQKRFLAKKIIDGKYEIELAEQDFKLTPAAQASIVSIIEKDC